VQVPVRCPIPDHSEVATPSSTIASKPKKPPLTAISYSFTINRLHMSSKTKGYTQSGQHIFRNAGKAISLTNKSVPYGCCFSNDIPIQCNSTYRSVHRYLATVAGRYVTIFRTNVTINLSNPDEAAQSCSGPLEPAQSYYDPCEDEELYCCVFAGTVQSHTSFLMDKALADRRISAGLQSHEYKDYLSLPVAKRRKSFSPSREREKQTGSQQLLCVGGKGGVVKVVDTWHRRLLYSLRCLDEVWDLQRSPVDEWIIVSASKDTTARIWNLQDGGSLLYILGGHGGHRDALIAGTCVDKEPSVIRASFHATTTQPLLVASWHPSGEWVATTGIDMHIKIWNVDRCGVQVCDNDSNLMFGLTKSQDTDTKRQQMPVFSTASLHNSAVDSISFVGDLLISRSCDECIELWSPRGLFDGCDVSSRKHVMSDFIHLRHFHIPCSQCLWYVKCAVDPTCRLLAAGNDRGEVYVWDIFGSDEPLQILTTSSSKQQSCIRDVKFSRDGTTLVATDDSGTMTKWDLIGLEKLCDPGSATS
jgi:polycomb protein EED